jgi:hypothetical protein
MIKYYKNKKSYLKRLTALEKSAQKWSGRRAKLKKVKNLTKAQKRQLNNYNTKIKTIGQKQFDTRFK